MRGRKTSPITGKHHILQDFLYLSCFNCIELTCRSRPPSVVGRCALFLQMIFQHLAYRFVFNYSPSIFFPRLLSYFMCTAVVHRRHHLGKLPSLWISSPRTNVHNLGISICVLQSLHTCLCRGRCSISIYSINK